MKTEQFLTDIYEFAWHFGVWATIFTGLGNNIYTYYDDPDRLLFLIVTTVAYPLGALNGLALFFGMGV